MGGFNQQSQDVEFMPGIRQDFSPVRAPRGALVDAQNVRFGRQGEIRGRRGTRAVAPDTTTSSHAIQGQTERIGVLGQVGDVGILGVAGKLFARDTQAARFDYLGRYSAFRPVKQWSVSWQAGISNGVAKYGCAVNSDGYVAVVTIIQAVTPTMEVWIFAPNGTPIANLEGQQASKAQLLAVGTAFYLVKQVGTALTVNVFTFSAGSFTASAGVSVGTLTSASAFWDTCPTANGTQWILAFQSGAAVMTMNLFTGTTLATNLTQSVTGTCPCSVSADASNVWLGWHNNPTVTGEVQYRAATTSLSGFSAAAVTIATSTTYGPPLIGSMPSGTNKLVLFRRSLAAVSPFTVATGRATISTSAVVQAAAFMWHAVPITKPLLGRAWVWTGCQATNWTTERAVLVNFENEIGTTGQSGLSFPELSGPQMVKRSSAATLPSVLPDLFSMVATGSSSYFVALPVILATDGASDLIQLGLYEYKSTAHAAYRQLADLGRGGLLAGQPQHIPSRGTPRLGSLIQSDSSYSRVAEVGFVYAPAVLAAVQAAGGSLTASGTYSWIFLFESGDGAFERHRSGMSDVYTVGPLGGGNQRVNFTITHPDITHRDGAKLIGYRTVNGGNTFFRESALSSSTLDFDVTTGTLAYTSSSADAAISDNEEAYTSQGRKSNALAPACIFSCVSEDRVWLGGLWDGTILQASKIRVPGEPVQFTDHGSFKVVLPETCTGLAYIDGAVVAFARRAIYAVTGEGPTDAGVGSWSTPRAICRDIGCVDYASILETCVGVLFKGERGYYLLPRGLGRPVFIGAAVQRMTSPTGDAYTTVLGAAVYADSETHTARFLVQNAAGTAERVLVYDLDIAAADPSLGWSYDTYADRLAAIGTWPDGLALAKQDLSSATHALYLDESSPTYATDASNTEDITTVVEAARLRPAGLAGWWQCSMVGAAMSSADGGLLIMTVTTDGDSATPSISVGGPWSMASGVDYQYRFVCPTVQQCTDARVRLSCTRTGVLGPVFHGLTVVQSPAGAIRLAGDSER